MPNKLSNAFTAVKPSGKTGKGYAGFDNPRENIDPHIKTKVVNSVESIFQKIKLLDKTSGSIIFINSNNELAENKENLFWDDANKRLGIGTTNPENVLDVEGTVAIGQTTITHNGPYWGDYDSAGLQIINPDVSGEGWHKTKQLNLGIFNNNLGSGVGFLSLVHADKTAFPLLSFSAGGAGSTSSITVQTDQFKFANDKFINVVDSSYGASIQALGMNSNSDLEMGIGYSSFTGIGNVHFLIGHEDRDFKWINHHGYSTLMTLTGEGDLGIGLTNPDSKLEVNGDVHVDGLIYFEGDNTGLPYAQIYEEDGNSTLTLMNQNVFYQMIAFTTNGESNNATPDHNNDHIIIDKAGRYLITINISLSQTTNNLIKHLFQVRTNNGSTNHPSVSVYKDTTGADVVGNCGCTGIIDLDRGDTVELWVKRLNGGIIGALTITIPQCSITISHLGGT